MISPVRIEAKREKPVRRGNDLALLIFIGRFHAVFDVIERPNPRERRDFGDAYASFTIAERLFRVCFSDERDGSRGAHGTCIDDLG